MTPELARLLFPKTTQWHIKRACEALLSLYVVPVVFFSAYRDTFNEVFRP